MKKVLIARKVAVAEDLAQEARTRGKRPVVPGDRVRYYYHDAPEGRENEAVLVTGRDRVELTRVKEPRVFLEKLGKWLFSRDCAILPRCRWPADG